MFLVGESASGVPIYANKAAQWADHIIGIGAIFPHAVAGFSGGGKIVVPGITTEATCGDMHWAMYGIPPRQLYGQAENPVRAIIDEMALKAGLDYIVDAVLDENGRVVDMVVGHPVAAHRAGCELARQHYGVRVPGPADIVIFDSFGTDIEYWQAIKAITPAGIVMKDDGVVIQVASCPEGVSVSHPEVLEFGYRPLAVVEGSDETGAGQQERGRAHDPGQRGDRGSRPRVPDFVGCFTTGRRAARLSPRQQRTGRARSALKMKGPEASIIVLRHAGDLLPVF